ncbi:MAG: hypothetical protein HRS57_02580 [Mycoplasmataceae bacterium]|nr:hypothetical protein [Mycoplasmataceae bacterium]
MDLFLGTYNYNIDDKKRLRLPPKFKELLGKDVVITAIDNSELSLVSADKFNDQVNRMLSSHSNSNQKQRSIIKFITSRSVELKVDASGRILIPEEMINFSSISKEVVVLGWGDRVGITSKEKYDINNGNLETEKTMKEGIESFEELFMM